MDDVDRQILSILKNDSRLSHVEVAKRVGISEGAVRRRIKRLIKSNVIRRFTAEIDGDKLASAITLVSIKSNSSTAQVAERLKQIPSIERVYEVTGFYDVAALLTAPTISEVARVVDSVRRTEGVSSTNTIIIMRTIW